MATIDKTIDNTQVIRFALDNIRPMSDQMLRLYYKAKLVLADYNNSEIGSLINAAGASGTLSDGATGDGRTPITGGDIYNFVTALQAFVAFVEGGEVPTLDRTSVVAKPHVQQIIP